MSNPSTEKLVKLFQENVLIIALTLFSSISVLIQQYTSLLETLGVELTYIDIFIILFLLFSLIQLFFKIKKKIKADKERPIGFSQERKEEDSLINILFKHWLLLFFGVMLFIFLIVSLNKPLNLLYSSDWKLCGSVYSKCKEEDCILLLDKWKRPVSSNCFTSKDESGFFLIEKTNWYLYKPKYIRFKCKQEESKIFMIEKTHFETSKCAGEFKY